MPRHRFRFAILTATLILAAVASAGAQASTSVPFSLSACANGNPKTVASGTDMFLGTGWVAEGEGLTKVGVQATVLDVAVNGVPLTDTAAFWAAPTPAYFPGQYVAYWAYPLGPVSRTFTVSFTWTLTHPVVDRVFLNANGSPFVYPSGVLLSGSCTVTVQ